MKKLVLFFALFAYALHANAQRNVILLVADDLGTDWCGFYEDHADTVSLPHIRTLLSKGVRFQNAMATPWCSPTRAGIFTGRYSFRTGVGTVIVGAGSAELDTGEITIPRLLKIYDPGIGTGQIGKWHLQTNVASHWSYPGVMGYDHYAGCYGGLSSFFNWTKITNGVSSNITNYATTEQVNDALSWINTQTNKPFFLWLAFNAAHMPYHLPPAGLYSDTSLSGTEADINAHPKSYFKADLEALDHEIGRLFDSLQAMNRLDSTDFIFIGDNGNTTPTAQIADTNRAKGTIYQYGVHVPFIVSGPSVVNPGRVSDALVNTVDIFSTVLELFGDTTWQSQIPVSKPVDSRSILPIIKGTSTQIRPWAFTEIFKPTIDSSCGKAMRNIDYKLLSFDFGHQEFYNLTTDPGETNNLLSGTLSSTDFTNYSYLCAEMNNLTGTEDFCNDPYLTTVAIAASATKICNGTNVTFASTITNGGISPAYHWKKNGNNVGTNSNSYSSNSLHNGDIITCVLTTDSDTATSNSIIMIVNPIGTPSISISASSSAICSGTSVTFNAVSTYGGSSPSYQWKKNGNNVGNHTSSYIPNSLSNGNVISCVLTSSASCVTSSTANSNQITMAVSNGIPAKPAVISGIKNSLCNTSADYTYTIPIINKATSYLWSVPSNATIVSGQGTTTLVVNYSSLFVSGIISVKSLNYCGSSALRTLNVFAKPAAPGTITGPGAVCANQQNISYSIASVPGATSYKWALPPGSSFTGGQNSIAVVINFGTTAGDVSVFAKNSCGSSGKIILPVTINCRMSDEANNENKNILSVINPFTDAIIFSVNSDLNNTVISLYDIAGREIYQKRNVFLVENEQQQLMVERNITPGIYLLTIKNSEVSLISKVIHQ